MKRIITVALATLTLLSMSSIGSAEVELTFANQDDMVNVIYTPADGTLGLEVGKDLGSVTSFQILSNGQILVGEKPAEFVGLFDVYTAEKSFRLDPNGFDSVTEFARVAAGTDSGALLADFTFDGSLSSGGGIDNVAFVVVPEPSSLVLIGLGCAALVGYRRRS